MAKRSLPEIYESNIRDLEQKRERNVNRYIIPIEMKIEAEKEKVRNYYLKKGIHL